MTQEVLHARLTNNPLEYRSILTIPRNIKFGLEIEVENIDYNQISSLVKKNIGTNWIVKKDESLEINSSAEIATPVLYNDRKTWITLKKMGELLQKIKASYNKCSFQINFDGSLLPTTSAKLRFLKLFAMYEDIIFKFSMGEDINYRDSLYMYSSPIILALKDVLQMEDEELCIERFSNKKSYAIAFKTIEKDLIEFRTPNGTSNPILWQNYITLFYYLLTLSLNNKNNICEINEYIDRFSTIHLLETYKKIDEQKALDFSQLLFKKQTDQTYFMHQYLGLKK